MTTLELEPLDASGSQRLHDQLAYVRYGYDDGGAKQKPVLHSIQAPVPDDAIYASPVYLLTPGQRAHHDDRYGDPYAVSGTTCIAKELQDDCENDGRVLYPVHVETDATRDVGMETALSWVREFIQEALPVSVYDCRLYYSGGRSIHAHVPLFVRLNYDLQAIKQRCESFDGDLDAGIYSRKRQFRLPGVPHAKTGDPKVRIHPEWDREEIAQAVLDGGTDRPATYADVLEAVFDQPLTAILGDLDDLVWRLGEPDVTTNDADESEPDLPDPVGQSSPSNSEARRRWRRFNWKHYSPYANVGSGNGRSVAVIRPWDDMFNVPDGYAHEYLDDGYHYVPASIKGAIGGGGEYRRFYTDGPVKLSKSDAGKWAFEDGAWVVIIGTRSRRSRLFAVDRDEGEAVAALLEANGRDEALAFLRKQGYEVGGTGPVLSTESEGVTDPGPSRAARLQHQAEQDGIETLTHIEELHITNRLAKIGGRDLAQAWFKAQYGATFDREVFDRQYRSVVGRYDDLP